MLFKRHGVLEGEVCNRNDCQGKIALQGSAHRCNICNYKGRESNIEIAERVFAAWKEKSGYTDRELEYSNYGFRVYIHRFSLTLEQLFAGAEVKIYFEHLSTGDEVTPDILEELESVLLLQEMLLQEFTFFTKSTVQV